MSPAWYLQQVGRTASVATSRFAQWQQANELERATNTALRVFLNHQERLGSCLMIDHPPACIVGRSCRMKPCLAYNARCAPSPPPPPPPLPFSPGVQVPLAAPHPCRNQKVSQRLIASRPGHSDRLRQHMTANHSRQHDGRPRGEPSAPQPRGLTSSSAAESLYMQLYIQSFSTVEWQA